MRDLMRGVTTAAVLAASSPALATVYGYADDNPGAITNSGAAGTYQSVSGLYDTESDFLRWTSEWQEEKGLLPNGFWLVISDGPNAKGNDSIYAVLYGALAGEDMGTLSAHVYDGVNGGNSWYGGEFIATFNDAVTITDDGNTRTMSFEIDATVINDFAGGNWFGTGFGSKIGVWEHAFSGGITFDDKGHVDFLERGTESWYDLRDGATSIEPPLLIAAEPGLLALIASGLILVGLSAGRRRSS